MSTKTKKPMLFKLHGQAFDPTGSVAIFQRVNKLVAVLDKLEDGEIITAEELGAKAGLTARGASEYAGKLREMGYCAKTGSKNLYGNKDTITALKQRLEE